MGGHQLPLPDDLEGDGVSRTAHVAIGDLEGRSVGLAVQPESDSIETFGAPLRDHLRSGGTHEVRVDDPVPSHHLGVAPHGLDCAAGGLAARSIEARRIHQARERRRGRLNGEAECRHGATVGGESDSRGRQPREGSDSREHLDLHRVLGMEVAVRRVAAVRRQGQHGCVLA